MQITFIGQLGLPTLSQRDAVSPEWRVAQLSRELAATGHNVTVFATGENFRPGVIPGIDLVPVASLNPQKPGGYLYLLSSFLKAIKQQPDAIHIHGSRALNMARIFHPLLFKAKLILTIDNNFKFEILNSKLKIIDEIITPTRTLQYRLLAEHDIRAKYIPDGFTPLEIELPRVPNFRLKPGTYSVALATSHQDVKRIAAAWAKAKTKQKLVIMADSHGQIKRLAKQYRFLKFAGNQTGRSRLSIINGAKTVVIGDDTTELPLLLEIMHMGKPIISTLNPLYQETLGTTVRFINLEGTAASTEVIRKVTHSPYMLNKLGKSAQKRAERHFTWDNIIPEYTRLYHQTETIQVPLDSAIATPFTQAV